MMREENFKSKAQQGTGQQYVPLNSIVNRNSTKDKLSGGPKIVCKKCFMIIGTKVNVIEHKPAQHRYFNLPSRLGVALTPSGGPLRAPSICPQALRLKD